MVCTMCFMHLKRLLQLLAVADGEDDGTAFIGQRIDHADAEVAQCRVVGGGEPARQVQDVHGLTIVRFTDVVVIFCKSNHFFIIFVLGKWLSL